MDLSNKNVIHVVNGDCEYLQFRRLLEYNDVLKHAYGLKPYNFKVMEGADNKNAFECYQNLCNCIGVDYDRLVRPNQKHTDVVKVVDLIENSISHEKISYEDTDGLVTDKMEIVLGTVNADCILLMFFDPVKKVIANVHSGWRGTIQKIAVNAVNKMIEEFQSNPKDIICCICPSIRKCHFEVENDVKDMFEETFGYMSKVDEFIEYVGKDGDIDKWVIDTVMINKIMLHDMGLLEENIIDSGICSVCNSEKVHSFRVDKDDAGRGAALISLRG